MSSARPPARASAAARAAIPSATRKSPCETGPRTRAPDGWHERRIGLARDGCGLAYALDPLPSPEADLFPAPCEGAPLGSVWEVRPRALALARHLGARLAQQGGMALFIDYARHAQPWGESLQAVRAHKRHEVLDEPGSADLSALVDFASFGAAAEVSSAYRRLVDGDQMGMLFKVMALAAPNGPRPEGFAA